MAGSIDAFRSTVLSLPRRSLPWRDTTDPYHILVSEIMLQQTQVGRVIPYYLSWLQRWPTVHSLAKATRPEVLQAWQGLGYNKRAIHLHQCAQIISETYHGSVLAALHSKLPGVGPYTARAIRIFSANEDSATVDTNIRRILIHTFSLPPTISGRGLQAVADQCLPLGRSRDWHNALMDYGQLLTARKTNIRPKTKQSKFEGSARQLRAKILREVLQQKTVTFRQLSLLEKNSPRLKQALDSLLHDRLLSLKNNKYTVPP